MSNKPRNLYQFLCCNGNIIGNLAAYAILHSVSKKKSAPDCDGMILPSKTEWERARAFCRKQARAWARLAREKGIEHFGDCIRKSRTWEEAENEVDFARNLLEHVFNPEVEPDVLYPPTLGNFDAYAPEDSGDEFQP